MLNYNLHNIKLIIQHLNLESKFINKTKILLTSGSDSAIKFIFETYTKQKDKVAYFWPTYGMIDFYCSLYGCKSKKINYDRNLNLNLNELIKTCKNKIKVLITKKIEKQLFTR